MRNAFLSPRQSCELDSMMSFTLGILLAVFVPEALIAVNKTLPDVVFTKQSFYLCMNTFQTWVEISLDWEPASSQIHANRHSGTRTPK